MKRFIGLSLVAVGGAVALWAAAHALGGRTDELLRVTPDFRVTSLTAGLVGLAVGVVGLVWVRD